MSEQPNVKRLFTPVAISFGYDGFSGNMRTGSLPHDENRHANGGLNYVTGNGLPENSNMRRMHVLAVGWGAG